MNRPPAKIRGESSLIDRLVGPKAVQEFLKRAQQQILSEGDRTEISEKLHNLARDVGVESWSGVMVEIPEGRKPEEELQKWVSFGYPPLVRPELADEQPGLLLARWNLLLLSVPPHDEGHFLLPLVQDVNVVSLHDPDRVFELPRPIRRDDAGLELFDSIDLVYPDPLPGDFDRDRAGQGVRVAIIDSGIDAKHPALKGKVKAYRDFSGEEMEKGRGDFNGHGTHCAGIVAAKGESIRGVAPGVELIDAKALTESGSGSTLSIAAAIRWAADQGAQVINLSLGGGDVTDGQSLLSRLCDAVAEEGIVVAVSAGNAGPEERTISSPGDARRVLSTGAVDKQRRLANFSSRGPTYDEDFTGPKPDLVAPGVGIIAPRSGDSPGDGMFVSLSGTSMAAPHVAGAAATVLGYRKGLGSGDVRNVILENCTSLIGDARGTGRGLLNVSAALSSLSVRVRRHIMSRKSVGILSASAVLAAAVALVVVFKPGFVKDLFLSAKEDISHQSTTQKEEYKSRKVEDDPRDKKVAEDRRSEKEGNKHRKVEISAHRSGRLARPSAPPDRVRAGCYRLWEKEGILQKKVLKNDALIKWADWYFVDREAFARWNDLHKDAKLYKSKWHLVSLSHLKVGFHRVISGETISDLLKRYRIPNRWYLSAWNCLPVSGTIRKGDELMILTKLK